MQTALYQPSRKQGMERNIYTTPQMVIKIVCLKKKIGYKEGKNQTVARRHDM